MSQYLDFKYFNIQQFLKYSPADQLRIRANQFTLSSNFSLQLYIAINSFEKLCNYEESDRMTGDHSGEHMCGG